MLGSESRDRNIAQIIERLRRVLSGMENGDWRNLDTGSNDIESVIITKAMDHNPIFELWQRTVMEVKDIMRTVRGDDRRARQLIDDIRRSIIALESGDVGVLRYRSDMPAPKHKTTALEDDPLYVLWQSARNELHTGITLALNNQTFQEYIERLQAIVRENQQRMIEESKQ